MKWDDDAEKAVSRAPFFVRKRIRRRVEEEAQNQGARRVTMAHVQASQRRFINNMEKDVRGFRLESCFGAGGCPNRAAPDDGLIQRLEEILARADLKSFLQTRVDGPLKYHHEFRITLADCPNACSRPQIVDLGIIGARRPAYAPDLCTACGQCVETCKEQAFIQEGDEPAVFDPDKCVSCGACLEFCPSGALTLDQAGWRILAGGKLGRHPQLGRELPGIYSSDQAAALVERCLAIYKENNRQGERFGEILDRVGLKALLE